MLFRSVVVTVEESVVRERNEKRVARERETNSLVKEGARKARKHGREEKAKIVSERGEMTQLKHIKN